MNNIEFKNRLIMILKLRTKITRQELVNTLNQFWQFNKPNIETIYIYYCYSLLASVLHKFDSVIYESNNKYYYVYKDILIKHLNS